MISPFLPLKISTSLFFSFSTVLFLFLFVFQIKEQKRILDCVVFCGSLQINTVKVQKQTKTRFSKGNIEKRQKKYKGLQILRCQNTIRLSTLFFYAISEKKGKTSKFNKKKRNKRRKIREEEFLPLMEYFFV